MARYDARRLLNRLLDGEPLPSDFVQEILERPLSEGVHLEYKGWPFFEEKDSAVDLRRYVAGFANADGGVLLIGIAETKVDGRLTGLHLDGDPNSRQAVNPEERISRALTDIAYLLVPQPRVQVVTHEGRPVIAIAVPRTSAMVWCVHDGRPFVYFIRFGDQTLAAPDWLYADIATGRRARPIFVIEETGPEVRIEALTDGRAVQAIHCTINNQSLVWVERAIFGCLGYFADGGQPIGPPASSLLQHADVDPFSCEGWSLPTRLGTYGGSAAKDLLPFQPYETGLNLYLSMPPNPAQKFRWRGVVYLVPENCPPSFWQLEVWGSMHLGTSHSLRKLHDDERGVVSLAEEGDASA